MGGDTADVRTAKEGQWTLALFKSGSAGFVPSSGTHPRCRAAIQNVAS